MTDSYKAPAFPIFGRAGNKCQRFTRSLFKITGNMRRRARNRLIHFVDSLGSVFKHEDYLFSGNKLLKPVKQVDVCLLRCPIIMQFPASPGLTDVFQSTTP